MPVKICKTCNIEKDISEFGTYANSKKCKSTERRTRNSCKKCRTIHTISIYKANPIVRERSSKAARKCHLKNKYNMIEDDYVKMVENQESKCKICNKFSEKLNIDHCHDTGKVRGLLCWDCNTALGKFKDNINNLLNAIKYLGG
jgi:hypothetical protein